jgi:hypothetical protein
LWSSLPCQHLKDTTITKPHSQGENKKPQDLSHGSKKKKAVGTVAAHGLPSFMRPNLASGQAMDSF